MGHRAADAITTGSYNTGLGFSSLGICTTGHSNTAVGRTALESITTGIYNTSVGFDSGQNISTGIYNTCIGYYARPSTAVGENQIVIGRDIVGNGDNKISMGSNSGYIWNSFTVNASWTQVSDERVKKNIQDDTLGLDFVNRLRTRTFQWKPQNENPSNLVNQYNEVNGRDTNVVMHGFVAQEVKAALDAVGVDTFAGWAPDEGDGQAVSREMFVMPLVKALQELSAKNDALETQNATFAARLTALEGE